MNGVAGAPQWRLDSRDQRLAWPGTRRHGASGSLGFHDDYIREPCALDLLRFSPKLRYLDPQESLGT